MKQEPETYEELIRTKRCIDLTKYYELSKEELDEIYIFLTENPQRRSNRWKKVVYVYLYQTIILK